MRAGDLVSLAPNGYAQYGVAEEKRGPGRSVWVSTGTANYQMLFEEADLTVIGRIVLGADTRAPVSGSRHRSVEIRLLDGRCFRESVRTRDGKDGSHETRAFMIRRMALEQVMRQWKGEAA